MMNQSPVFLLFHPGFLFVPESVWHSRFFWISVAVLIVGSLLYHNFFSKNGRPGTSSNGATGNNNPVTAKISYSSDGRSGHVHYQRAAARFALYYEFGGGDCVACIDIPSVENWEKHTGLSVAQRDAVLDFIGMQVVKDQTTGGKGHFKIEGNWLNIYV